MLKRTLIVLLETFYRNFTKKRDEIRYLYHRRVYRAHILSPVKTIMIVKRNRLSVARYGDGEFGIALSEWGAGFQEKSERLSTALLEVLGNTPTNLLICIPHYYNYMYGAKRKVKKIWKNMCKNKDRQKRIIQLLREKCGGNYFFGDSLITRPYMDMRSPRLAQKVFPAIKEIWDNEKILIVEGEKTRLGIGNDLFNNAKSVKRILAPTKNAFSVYDEIKIAVKKHYDGGVCLIALGPTATVLAADLAKEGIWAFDIGHIDVEYEWFLSRAKEKTPIAGKYVNECTDGKDPSECLDKKYNAQIVAKVV